MTFWKKLKNWKNWLIGKLGGKSKAEYDGKCKELRDVKNELSAARKKLHDQFEEMVLIERYHDEWYDKYAALSKGIKTAQAEVRVVNYGPGGQNFDQLKSHARKEIIRQLGEAVYEYAKHTVTDTGDYIVDVNILANDYGGD